MEQIASLRSCLDNDGNFDPVKFAQLRNQRCQYFDEDEEEVVVPKKGSLRIVTMRDMTHNQLYALSGTTVT